MAIPLDDAPDQAPPDPVVLVDADPAWPGTFTRIRERVASALGDLTLAIDHVGSTAVPGLPAKPIVDVDVVVPVGGVSEAIERLATLGYVHRGDLGVAGREAFARPPGTPPHHLYVCARDAPECRRHLVFRDYLRAHPDVALAYADLKKELARRFRDDRAAYSQAKSAFVEDVLRRAGAGGDP
ncbi:MAG: GrpB family protein [Chloroflexota bacterium]|nr:GrpB family protein [Chloroflexota bacterium]